MKNFMCNAEARDLAWDTVEGLYVVYQNTRAIYFAYLRDVVSFLTDSFTKKSLSKDTQQFIGSSLV